MLATIVPGWRVRGLAGEIVADGVQLADQIGDVGEGVGIGGDLGDGWFDAGGSLFESAGDAFSDLTGIDAFDGITDSVGNAMDEVGNAVDDAADSAGHAAEDAADDVGDAGEGAGDDVGEAVDPDEDDPDAHDGDEEWETVPRQ